MAKIELNSALKAIHGGLDNWVYRNIRGQMVLSRRPTASGTVSEAQADVRERFRHAAAYAKATLLDTIQRAAYDMVAKAKGLPVFSVMLTDFLKPPVVELLDLTAYHGQVGDVIRVSASDYVGVTAVNVAIRAPDLTVREEGAAVLQSGVWVYTATTLRIAEEAVTITATAVDRPGHTGTKIESWV